MASLATLAATLSACQRAVLDSLTRRATMDAAAGPLVECHRRPRAVPAAPLVVGRPAGRGSVCCADSDGSGDCGAVGAGGRPHVVPAGRPAGRRRGRGSGSPQRRARVASRRRFPRRRRGGGSCPWPMRRRRRHRRRPTGTRRRGSWRCPPPQRGATPIGPTATAAAAAAPRRRRAPPRLSERRSTHRRTRRRRHASVAQAGALHHRDRYTGGTGRSVAAAPHPRPHTAVAALPSPPAVPAAPAHTPAATDGAGNGHRHRGHSAALRHGAPPHRQAVVVAECRPPRPQRRPAAVPAFRVAAESARRRDHLRLPRRSRGSAAGAVAHAVRRGRQRPRDGAPPLVGTPPRVPAGGSSPLPPRGLTSGGSRAGGHKCAVSAGATPAADKDPAPVAGAYEDKRSVPARSPDSADSQVAADKEPAPVVGRGPRQGRRPRRVGRRRRRQGARRRGGGGQVGGDQVRRRGRRHCGRGKGSRAGHGRGKRQGRRPRPVGRPHRQPGGDRAASPPRRPTPQTTRCTAARRWRPRWWPPSTPSRSESFRRRTRSPHR